MASKFWTAIASQMADEGKIEDQSLRDLIDKGLVDSSKLPASYAGKLKLWADPNYTIGISDQPGLDVKNYGAQGYLNPLQAATEFNPTGKGFGGQAGRGVFGAQSQGSPLAQKLGIGPMAGTGNTPAAPQAPAQAPAQAPQSPGGKFYPGWGARGQSSPLANSKFWSQFQPQTPMQGAAGQINPFTAGPGQGVGGLPNMGVQQQSTLQAPTTQQVMGPAKQQTATSPLNQQTKYT